MVGGISLIWAIPIEIKNAPYPGETQTALYGDHDLKPGEVDFIYTPRR